MPLRCLIIFLTFTVTVYSETLETVRQQFEIYQRFTGELEILLSDNVEEVDSVLKRTETKRQAVRKELDKAQIEGEVVQNLPSPLFVENYADPFFHYVAVERAFALRSLQQGKPDETMSAIQYVYYLTQELADSGSLELRAVAARIRLQMLETVQSFLLNPHCRHEHHEQMYKIFDHLVNRRPTESEFWTLYCGEGKRFFEEIPRRGLNKMVSPKLLKELQERHAFDGYEKAAAQRFTQDRSAFLRVMPIVIEISSLPYYERAPMLRQLDEGLRERQGTETEPVFTLLLLRDIAETMRLFTQERSGNEIAYFALSAALRRQQQGKMRNFLTGNEYELHLITDGIMCTYEGNIKPFYVPYR